MNNILTTIYLIRHSQVMRRNDALYITSDNEQLINEKMILDIEGEERAKKLSKIADLHNIDVLWSSNYVRAMATAKYIANENNIPLNIDDRFGERKIGDMIGDWHDHWTKQYHDPQCKMPNGECQEEVQLRMWEAIKNIIKNNTGKRIAIVSHSAAIAFLLLKWCKLGEIDATCNKRCLYFNDKEVINDSFKAPEIFKLVFDNMDLISIKRINYE